MAFNLTTDMTPKGGQPDAIKKLVEGHDKFPRQTLLGITGSGKTFVMANVIQSVGKPTLVLAHNKTLAAQLYAELKGLFPKNRVEYFVSYFDYYQPESYMPASDTYIEKDSSRNEKIEQMRLRATTSLMSRDDVIIVASISCIYGLGNPQEFLELSLGLEKGMQISREEIIKKLVDVQYERNDMALEPGKFRVRGDVIDVIPGYEDTITRIELFGDEIERIREVHNIDGKIINELERVRIFPAKHFVTTDSKQEIAIQRILEELEGHLPKLGQLEAHRLEKRTKYDVEMLRELGYCTGVENYSRHFENRRPGTPPHCLLDFFPDDFLFIIDESHQSIPQSHGMYKGDYARKKNLIDYGFRLPSAFDNRPLKFEEFEKYFNHVIFVSATPSDYEIETSGQVVEQIIRPTGLLDPTIDVRQSKNQIDDLIEEVNQTVKKNSRVLVTTLTKRMAEDLTDYLAKAGIKVRYLHSEIDTIERTEIIRQLRLGEFDVLVGINLLREGIDIPEVALVAILDADKQGFLRNERSLIQTIGRAARNADGHVILYADKTTDAMRAAIQKTRNRRTAQEAYNKLHGITPETIIKVVGEAEIEVKTTKHLAREDLPKEIIRLEAQMRIAAENLEFEEAIALRNRMASLEREMKGSKK